MRKCTEMRSSCKILFGKRDMKRALGKSRRRCEEIITMDHNEMGWKSVDCICLAEDGGRWMAAVNKIINHLNP
jgi:hypothetical protein